MINIVTKNINTDINSSSDEYKIGLFAGQFSTFGADAYGRTPVSNNISIDLYYNHAQSYGYPAFDNTHNYSFDINTTGASAKLNLNDTDILAIRFAADYRDFDARYFYTASSFDKSKEQVNRLFGQTYLRINSFENHSIVANLGIIRTTDDFVFNPAFALSFTFSDKK